MSLQAFENKVLSRGIRGKSAPILAEITIRKSQKFSLFLCAVWYPESLLAYPKETIRKALETALLTYELQGEKETVTLLEAGLANLDNFIDDEEAYNRNHKVMGQKSYWEALRQQN